jgi:hypothetical protein
VLLHVCFYLVIFIYTTKKKIVFLYFLKGSLVISRNVLSKKVNAKFFFFFFIVMVIDIIQRKIQRFYNSSKGPTWLLVLTSFLLLTFTFLSCMLVSKASLFFFLSLFFYCFTIHMCIQGLGHFFPLTPPPPLPPTLPPPSPPHPLTTRQKLFCPYL